MGKGEAVFPKCYYCKQYVYDPLEISKPDLGLALAGAIIDIGLDLDSMFSKYGQAFNAGLYFKFIMSLSILTMKHTKGLTRIVARHQPEYLNDLEL